MAQNVVLTTTPLLICINSAINTLNMSFIDGVLQYLRCNVAKGEATGRIFCQGGHFYFAVQPHIHERLFPYTKLLYDEYCKQLAEGGVSQRSAATLTSKFILTLSRLILLYSLSIEEIERIKQFHFFECEALKLCEDDVSRLDFFVNLPIKSLRSVGKMNRFNFPCEFQFNSSITIVEDGTILLSSISSGEIQSENISEASTITKVNADTQVTEVAGRRQSSRSKVNCESSSEKEEEEQSDAENR